MCATQASINNANAYNNTNNNNVPNDYDEEDMLRRVLEESSKESSNPADLPNDYDEEDMLRRVLEESSRAANMAQVPRADTGGGQYDQKSK